MNKITAKVIDWAGKATGKHKHWFNLGYIGCDKDAESVDFSKDNDLVIIKALITDITDEAELSDEFVFCQNVSFNNAKPAELMDWKNHVTMKKL